MSSNADSLVRDAISAYRGGRKDQARNLLLQAVDLDERHEQAWLWLSAVVDTPEDQITCLENVLTINPDNEKARQGIQLLSQQPGSAPTAASSPQNEPDLEDEDPFANVSFTTAPQPAPAPASPPDDDSDDELPDTSSWSTIETSSASAQRPKNEPTPDDYNDWISGLNIGSNEAPEAFGLIDDDDDKEPVFTASPFIGDDDLAPFELDRDVFGFDDEDDVLGKSGAGPFSASPFSVDTDDVPEKPTTLSPSPTSVPANLASRPAASPPAPARPVSRDDDGILDDLEAEDDFDDVFEDDYDDAFLGTLDPADFFKFIPDEVKPTRLPGTNERYPALVIVSLLLLFILNGGALALVWLTLTRAI